MVGMQVKSMGIKYGNAYNRIFMMRSNSNFQKGAYAVVAACQLLKYFNFLFVLSFMPIYLQY